MGIRNDTQSQSLNPSVTTETLPLYDASASQPEQQEEAGGDVQLLDQYLIANPETLSGNPELLRAAESALLASMGLGNVSFDSQTVSSLLRDLGIAAPAPSLSSGVVIATPTSNTAQIAPSSDNVDDSDAAVSTDSESVLDAFSAYMADAGSTGTGMTSSTAIADLAQLQAAISTSSLPQTQQTALTNQLELIVGTSTTSDWQPAVSTLSAMLSQITHSDSAPSLAQAATSLLNDTQAGKLDALPNDVLTLDQAAQQAKLSDQQQQSLQFALAAINQAFTTGSAGALSAAVTSAASLVGDATGTAITASATASGASDWTQAAQAGSGSAVSTISGLGTSQAPPPSGVSQSKDKSVVKYDGYTIEFDHKHDKKNTLTITDSAGNDVTPPGFDKNAKAGYVTLPDGAALYIGDGGDKAKAYVLANGTSFDITQQNGSAPITAGASTLDFLNGTPPNGNVTGYTGPANDVASATYNYLQNYAPPPPVAHDIDPTSSGASSSSGATTPGINTQMGQVSQLLGQIKATDEAGHIGKAMNSLVQAAAGDDKGAFDKAYKAFVGKVNASAKGKAKQHGQDQDVDNLKDLLPTLSTISGDYTSGQRLTATDGSPDPAKDPAKWAGWSDGQTLPTVSTAGNPALNQSDVKGATKDATYAPPGGGVDAIEPGDSKNADFLKTFTGDADVSTFLKSVGCGADAASLQAQGWQVFNIKGANATVLYNPTSGKLQAFDTDTGKKQNMPPFFNKDHASGTLIFGDGTRLDVKNGTGLSFLSGNQLLTTTDPSQQGHQIDADSSSRGGFKTWTSNNPAAVTIYAETNATNPNHTAVNMPHTDMGGKDKAMGWAWTNGISKDGTQAWTSTGSGDQGGTGMASLAWLNDPSASQNSAVTRALYSLDASQKTTFSPSNASWGWNSKQIGTAAISWQNKAKNFLEKFGLDIGMGLAMLATAWIPGADAGVAAASASVIGGEAAADGAVAGAEGAVAATDAAEAAGEAGADAAAAGSEAAGEAAGEGATDAVGEGAQQGASKLQPLSDSVRTRWSQFEAAANTTTGRLVQSGAVVGGTGAEMSGTKAGNIIGSILTGVVGLDKLPDTVTSAYRGVAKGAAAAGAAVKGVVPFAQMTSTDAIRTMVNVASQEVSETGSKVCQAAVDQLQKLAATVSQGASTLSQQDLRGVLTNVSSVLKAGGLPDTSALADKISSAFGTLASSGKAAAQGASTLASNAYSQARGALDNFMSNLGDKGTLAEPLASASLDQLAASVDAEGAALNPTMRSVVDRAVSNLRAVAADPNQSVYAVRKAVQDAKLTFQAAGLPRCAEQADTLASEVRAATPADNAATPAHTDDEEGKDAPISSEAVNGVDLSSRLPSSDASDVFANLARSVAAEASGDGQDALLSTLKDLSDRMSQGSVTPQDARDMLASAAQKLTTEGLPKSAESAMDMVKTLDAQLGTAPASTPLTDVYDLADAAYMMDPSEKNAALRDQIQSMVNACRDQKLGVPETQQMLRDAASLFDQNNMPYLGNTVRDMASPLDVQGKAFKASDPVSSDLTSFWGNAKGLPDYRAVQQGGFGNCATLASLTNLAKDDPEAIKNMMTLNGDGTVTVSGLTNPYTHTPYPPETFPVSDAITEARDHGASIQGAGGGNQTWALVMDKAINDALRNNYSATKASLEQSARADAAATGKPYVKPGDPLQTNRQGAHPSVIYNMLTGQRNTILGTKNLTPEQLTSWVASQVDAGKPVLLAGLFQWGDKDSSHAYLVAGTRNINGTTQVGVVNPHNAAQTMWFDPLSFSVNFRGLYGSLT